MDAILSLFKSALHSSEVPIPDEILKIGGEALVRAVLGKEQDAAGIDAAQLEKARRALTQRMRVLERVVMAIGRHAHLALERWPRIDLH